MVQVELESLAGAWASAADAASPCLRCGSAVKAMPGSLGVIFIMLSCHKSCLQLLLCDANLLLTNLAKLSNQEERHTNPKAQLA